MLLVNKTERIIQLSEVNSENPNAAPTIIPIVGTVEMSDARWESLKNTKTKDKDGKFKPHPTIKAMLDEGWLEEIYSTPQKALVDLKPRDAMEVVEATVDMKLLAEWKKSEKRKPVSMAIDNQMKRLRGEVIEAGQSSEQDDE